MVWLAKESGQHGVKEYIRDGYAARIIFKLVEMASSTYYY